MKKDWEIKKLGDLVTQINGLWKGKKEPFINVAVIRNTNFSKDCKLKLDDVEYLDVELKQYSSRKLQAGDIIIEKSGGSDKQPVGRPILFNIEDGEYSFSNFTSTLRIKDVSQVSAEYLQQYLYFRWLNGDTRNLQSHTTGIHNLDFKAYLNFDIILPPLEQQKRIVKILDEKFAQLETIKANAQTNLQNTKDLFQSQLAKAFSNTSWEKKKFSELFKLSSGDYLNSKSIIKGEYPIYGGNGIIDYHKEYNLTGDNIIIGRVGALCGNVRYISEPIWLTDNAFKLSFIDFNYDYSFITYLLNHINLRSFARQAAQPVISNSSLKDIEIPLPPLTEQKRIVKELDTLSEKVKALQNIYEQMLLDCEELKQSFLCKAFAGEL